jgi:hypothetical protein
LVKTTQAARPKNAVFPPYISFSTQNPDYNLFIYLKIEIFVKNIQRQAPSILCPAHHTTHPAVGNNRLATN